MSQKRPQTPGLDVEVEIDYENIDVGRIMEAIKNKTGGERSQAAGPAGQRSKIKRLLLKVMTPFAPLIKLLILPVYEEQRQVLLSLHNTNQRLDALVARLNREVETHNRHREYTKLLHNLSHNLVVEMSKLKIEEEMLKTKTRILEKEFETLTGRERALEKKFLK